MASTCHGPCRVRGTDRQFDAAQSDCLSGSVRARRRARVPRTRDHRRVRGSAAGNPRTRDLAVQAGLESKCHSPPASRQGQPDRPGRHGHCRAAQPRAHLVVKPDRPGRRVPARHRPAWRLRRSSARATSRPSATRRSPSPWAWPSACSSRRTWPAMALTLAGSLSSCSPGPAWSAPTSSRQSASRPRSRPTSPRGSLLIMARSSCPRITCRERGLHPSNQTITRTGQAFVLPDVRAGATGTQRQCNAWFATQQLRHIVYQPASRYWTFQRYETAIFLALALGLAGFSLWRVGASVRVSWVSRCLLIEVWSGLLPGDIDALWIRH